jgi:hypothetical protein
MKYSQIRIVLLTFTFAIASVGFLNKLTEKWIASDIELPNVNSDTPIIIKVCTIHTPPTNLNIGGGSGGANDTMCDSIPVAFSEKRQ